MTALPLYHIFALTANFLVFARVGGYNHLITNPRDMPAFVKAIRTIRFTALTGVASGLMVLLAVRFLFGAGEAGALPNAARVLRAWFPESSRGRAQGFVTGSLESLRALVATAFAPKLYSPRA